MSSHLFESCDMSQNIPRWLTQTTSGVSYGYQLLVLLLINTNVLSVSRV